MQVSEELFDTEKGRMGFRSLRLDSEENCSLIERTSLTWQPFTAASRVVIPSHPIPYRH